jgi:hypothetical protein
VPLNVHRSRARNETIRAAPFSNRCAVSISSSSQQPTNDEQQPTYAFFRRGEYPAASKPESRAIGTFCRFNPARFARLKPEA